MSLINFFGFTQKMADFSHVFSGGDQKNASLWNEVCSKETSSSVILSDNVEECPTCDDTAISKEAADFIKIPEDPEVLQNLDYEDFSNISKSVSKNTDISTCNNNNSTSQDPEVLQEWDRECTRIGDLSYIDEPYIDKPYIEEPDGLEHGSGQEFANHLAEPIANPGIKVKSLSETKMPTEDNIRNRAYHIWLETGCSDEIANYYRAEVELRL
jgi:hypothetical protein